MAYLLLGFFIVVYYPAAFAGLSPTGAYLFNAKRAVLDEALSWKIAKSTARISRTKPI
jgi:hypothetical protein